MLHGHAVSVDMCYSAALALHLGHLSEAAHDRLLRLLADLGLALNHPEFTLGLLREGTANTVATRGGKLRAPIPTATLGTYVILQEVDDKTLEEAWHIHQRAVAGYPRQGLGVETTVDLRRSSGLDGCEGGITDFLPSSRL